jgi:NADPH:quinone reductase-like Zn-dependent oxidoreductase
MKAVIFDGPLRLADAPAPAPIPGEVLIRVVKAGKECPYADFRCCK